MSANPYNWPIVDRYLTASLPNPLDLPPGWIVALIDGSAGLLVNNGTAWVATSGGGPTTEDAVTNAVTNVVTINHSSTGTPAAGFGAGLLFTLESATVANREAALIATDWETAADATREAALVFSVYDHAAAYECLRMDGVGSVPRLGFFGHAAAARPTTYTITNLTTDRTFDANACADLEICDVLGTLITDLASLGLLVVA